MRAIGYIRVSTEEQSREGISLECQKAKIETYCNLNDLELVGILEDAGKSGKDLKREGVQTLIEQVKGRAVEAIVAYRLDRVSRRVKDILAIMELVDKKGVVFHSLVEKIDTKSATGRFFLNIVASMAEWERDTLSERIRDALAVRIAAGYRSGQVPTGFQVGDDPKRVVASPAEQASIRLMKKLRNEGCSLRRICAELTRRGHKPRGSRWHPTTVKRALEYTRRAA